MAMRCDCWTTCSSGRATTRSCDPSPTCPTLCRQLVRHCAASRSPTCPTLCRQLVRHSAASRSPTCPTLCRQLVRHSAASRSPTCPTLCVSTRPTQCRESVANLTDTVRVQLGMALIQLIDVVSLHECLGLTLPRRAILNAALLKPEMYNASQRRRSRTEPQTPVKIGRVLPVVSRRTDRQTDRNWGAGVCKGRSRIFVCSGGSAPGPGGSPPHPPNRS